MGTGRLAQRAGAIDLQAERSVRHPAEHGCSAAPQRVPVGDVIPERRAREEHRPVLREQHRIEGTLVRIYSPAKTIADCFKYRNKIGLDVALEALRDGWRERKATMDDLWRYARVCRVANVMWPYLVSLT